MTRGPDNDTYMSMPRDQVARFGMRYSLETRCPIIDVIRAGIGIGKAGALVDGVHQMGAIMLRVVQMFGIESRCDD